MLYYKNDGKQYIDPKSPQEINLNTALQEIENLPYTIGDSFIGFCNGKGEVIQFPRYEADNWLLDHPATGKGKAAYSFFQEKLTTQQVKDIVKAFFLGEDWRLLCNLKRTW